MSSHPDEVSNDLNAAATPGQMQSEIRPTSAGTERPAPGLGEVEMHPAGASVAKKCLPVAGGGRMVGPGGTYRPENYEWRNHLCVRNEHGRLVGKDPLAIPLDVLTASGHSNTTTRRFFKRLRDAHNINHPDDEDGWMVREHPRRLTEIRECGAYPALTATRPRYAAARSTTARHGRSAWVGTHTTLGAGSIRSRNG